MDDSNEVIGDIIPRNSPSRASKFRTVKEANFFGINDEYILSGSDDGRVYFWLKHSGKLVQALNADHRVVNCVQRPIYAVRSATSAVSVTSGIDYDIKVWEPIYGSSLSLRRGDAALTLNAPSADVVEDLRDIAKANEKMRVENLESPDVNINTARLIRMLAAMRIQGDCNDAVKKAKRAQTSPTGRRSETVN